MERALVEQVVDTASDLATEFFNFHFAKDEKTKVRNTPSLFLSVYPSLSLSLSRCLFCLSLSLLTLVHLFLTLFLFFHHKSWVNLDLQSHWIVNWALSHLHISEIILSKRCKWICKFITNIQSDKYNVTLQEEAKKKLKGETFPNAARILASFLDQNEQNSGFFVGSTVSFNKI